MKRNDIQQMHPSAQISEIMSRVYNLGMTTTTGGNISIIDNNGDIWITPSAIDKGTLTDNDISCIRKDGKITGNHKPSSEYPFHRAIFEARPDIKAIIHAHPPALVSFSIVRQIPNTNITPLVNKICGPVGYAAYDLPGSEELGDKIAGEFSKNEVMAVIMENHGLVLGGTDLLDAFARLETLELAAQTIINAKAIGSPVFLSDDQLLSFEKQIAAYVPEYFNNSDYDAEIEIRQEISSMMRRACKQGLMSSAFGTMSVRLKDDDFLITPSTAIRWNLMPEDIVRVKNGKFETGKIPCSSVLLHRDIYSKNPEINSIILTQPPYIMAFGIANVKFDVRTIPECWIFLLDVPNVPFGSQFKEIKTISGRLGKEIPSLIISNDSFIVTGKNLLQAFDRLEVAEFSAKSIVMTSSLGKMFPINDTQIEALRKKFLN